MIIVAGSDTTTATLSCKCLGRGHNGTTWPLFYVVPTMEIYRLTDNNLDIFYHLAHSPQILEKLRRELATFYVPGSASDFKDLQEAVYLNGVINEALRLHPPTPSGLQRLTPEEGIMIGSTFIPGDVTVSTPFWTLGRRKSFKYYRLQMH